MLVATSPGTRRGETQAWPVLELAISESPLRFAFAPRTFRRAGSFGAITAMAAAIAGCAAAAAPAPAVRPLMVQVPVLHETPCPVPVLEHPVLPISGLKPSSPPADTIRAYAAAVAILKGAVRERDAVLEGCARADHGTQAQAEKTR
jgi:hypothetical protein